MLATAVPVPYSNKCKEMERKKCGNVAGVTSEAHRQRVDHTDQAEYRKSVFQQRRSKQAAKNEARKAHELTDLGLESDYADCTFCACLLLYVHLSLPIAVNQLSLLTNTRKLTLQHARSTCYNRSDYSKSLRARIQSASTGGRSARARLL